jgi:hypothetical protein
MEQIAISLGLNILNVYIGLFYQLSIFIAHFLIEFTKHTLGRLPKQIKN